MLQSTNLKIHTSTERKGESQSKSQCRILTLTIHSNITYYIYARRYYIIIKYHNDKYIINQ